MTVIDLAEIVRGEFAENAIRKDFVPSEIDAIRRAMEASVATPEGRPRKTKESFLSLEDDRQRERGQTRDKIGGGAFAGVSGRTVEKIAKVVEARICAGERIGTPGIRATRGALKTAAC